MISSPSCGIKSLALVINKTDKYILKKYEKYIVESSWNGIPDLAISVANVKNILNEENINFKKLKPLKYENNSELNLGQTIAYLKKDSGSYLPYTKNHMVGISNGKVVDTANILGFSSFNKDAVLGILKID